jgi:hypothetical protein
MVELLWTDPETCVTCHSTAVAQRLVFGDPPQKIVRCCAVHAVPVFPEKFGEKGGNGSQLYTGRFLSASGMKQVTELELHEIRNKGCFMVVDLTVKQSPGFHKEIELWKNTHKCPIFVYKVGLGFKVAWRPMMEDLSKNQRSWTKDEIKMHAHGQVLYGQLQEIKPWGKEKMSIDNESHMMVTPVISDKDAAMVFALEVWRMESIMRDPDQLAVSIVMDE